MLHNAARCSAWRPREPRAGEWAADPKGHWGVSWPPTHAGPSGGKCIVVVGVVVVAAVVVAVAFVLKVRNSYTDGGRLVFKMGRLGEPPTRAGPSERQFYAAPRTCMMMMMLTVMMMR